MTEQETGRPPAARSGRTGAAHRQERLGAALRANLARRKAQARERAEAAEPRAGEVENQISRSKSHA